MKRLFVSFLLLFVLISVTESRILKFGSDGNFKIVQFTDVHYKPGNPASASAFDLIRETLDAEHPDLVVFTGDVVTGKPARQGWDTIMNLVISRNIPFAVTLGNHDDEQDMTREEIARLVTSYPLNLNSVSVEKVKGYLNDVIPVAGVNGKDTAVLLYCMDSNNYTTIPGMTKYGWFTSDQIAWYNGESRKYTNCNGGVPIPSLAFFHIPLPEYGTAYKTKKNRLGGKQREKECSPELNTGMYAAMLLNKDIMGTFVGHDHVNDYVASYHGIALCYGRFTGNKTTYGKVRNGARIIELKEGEKGFSTYVRLKNGKITDKVRF